MYYGVGYCDVKIILLPHHNNFIVSNNNNTTLQFSYSRANVFGSSMHSGVNEETKVNEI